METISNEALAAARAKLDAAESRRENILLFHIANGVNIESRTVQIDAVQNFALRFVGKVQITADDVARRAVDAAVRRLGQVQKAENFVTRGHAVHGNMEKGTQLPHGNKEIRRQQDNQQTSLKRNSSALVLGHRHDDAQCRTAVRDQVHNGDGV